MMAKRKTAKRTRYTDEFRANAVAAAISAGYPSVKGALSRVAGQFGVSHQVLRDWILANHNPAPQELLLEKKKELRDLFLDEIYLAADILPNKRGNASYSQLVIAIATMFDKIRLIDGMPTVIMSAMPELTLLADFLNENNIEMSTAIRDWRERLQARKVAINVSDREVKDA